jgi:hypothetical protein
MPRRKVKRQSARTLIFLHLSFSSNRTWIFHPDQKRTQIKSQHELFKHHHPNPPTSYITPRTCSHPGLYPSHQSLKSLIVNFHLYHQKNFPVPGGKFAPDRLHSCLPYLRLSSPRPRVSKSITRKSSCGILSLHQPPLTYSSPRYHLPPHPHPFQSISPACIDFAGFLLLRCCR